MKESRFVARSCALIAEACINLRSAQTFSVSVAIRDQKLEAIIECHTSNTERSRRRAAVRSASCRTFAERSASVHRRSLHVRREFADVRYTFDDCSPTFTHTTRSTKPRARLATRRSLQSIEIS